MISPFHKLILPILAAWLVAMPAGADEPRPLASAFAARADHPRPSAIGSLPPAGVRPPSTLARPLAPSSPWAPAGVRTSSTGWAAAGAAGGFGLGLWAGLTAFDDATDSDRKVWTTAIVSAAAGGVLGYLIARDR